MPLPRRQSSRAAAPAGENFPAQPSKALASQMLVRIARQSNLGNPEGCTAILSLLATSRLVRGHLNRLLGRLGLNEAKFSTLVTLYAFDPESSTPANLAQQSQVSRATMTGALEALHADGWINREQADADRRTLRIQLTTKGRAFVENAVRPFLMAVDRCADTLSPHEQRAVTRACVHLCNHFQPQSA